MVNVKVQYISFDSALHTAISGQNGLVASISSITSNTALTITGLTGMTANSVGHILTITNAATANNNGSFLITSFVSATSVRVDNTLGIAPDANNGSINWIEKLPYALEIERAMTDDLQSATGIPDGYATLNGLLTNTSNYYPFSNLPDGTPSVVEALNTLNQQIGNRDYSGGVLTDGYTITQSLQQLASNVITPTNHSTLRDLIHFIDEGPATGFTSGAYKEILPSADPFPTSVIWYTNNTKANKIIEKLITRNGSQIPINIIWNMYATDGITILHSITDTINYVNNVFETDRVRVIS